MISKILCTWRTKLLKKRETSHSSELYNACRDGDISTVENLLSTSSLDNVNRFESNDSTALHVASSNGHQRVVELLLEKGACRQQLDKNKMSPADVAPTPEIQQLFTRSSVDRNKRFSTDAPCIEWAKSSFDVREISLVNIMYTNPFPNLEEAFRQICSAEELQDVSGMNQIRYFLEEAYKKNDPSYLVRAYTASTGFYHCLNRLHAQLPFRKYTDEDRKKWYIQFSSTLDTDQVYAKFGWKGISYRGMMITEDDLVQYNVGDWIVNKAFLSTSQDLRVANIFHDHPPANKLGVLIKYYSTRDRNALDISSISEFPEEHEILIFPNAPFKVLTINRESSPIEIELSDK